MKKYGSLLMVLSVTVSFTYGQQKTTGEQVRAFETLPTLNWKYTTHGPVYASPVLSGTTVYTGSLDSTLYAVDVASGKMVWKFKSKGPIRSAAGVDQSRVYLLSGDGQVYAIEKNSGKVVWTFSTGGEKTYSLYGYADYFNSAPVVHDGMVYFGSGDGNIYALKSVDGTRLWSYQTDEVVHATPAIYKEKLFVGSFDGSFYALNNQTGKLLWKFKSVGQHFFPKGEFEGSPVVAGELGVVFVGSRDFNLYALDIEKGFCHWNKRYNSWALALTYQDKVLYAGTADEDTMYAYEALTGKELWKTNVRFNIFGNSVVDAAQLYFGTQQGKFLSLDKKSGELQWTFKTDGYNEHHATYFPSEDSFVKNDFYARVFRDGTEAYIKALEKLGAIYSTPVMTGDFIIFSSADGAVYCLKRS